ncbi:TPA: hypothetical protein ACH3X1_003327 [Trebouxia sp. C0004]
MRLPSQAQRPLKAAPAADHCRMHCQAGRLARRFVSLPGFTSYLPRLTVAAAPPGAERGVCSQGQSTVLAFPPGPPPPSEELPGWEDQACVSNLDVRRNIFCNRSLNMRSIRAVGFDMDYTLSQYKPETFEKLAHDLTVEKLVGVFGYPKIIATWRFDWRYMVRGLTIDKQRGNILKIDRHKYVKIAYHGFRELSRAERRAVYSDSNLQFEFDEPDFAMIDTLFSLAEAHLFMQLVELQDSQPDLLPPGKTRPDLYRDVRAAVDLCHRDGSLKQAVAKDPAKYIHEDSRLIGIMDMYRAAGKKLFVATNSLWDYTHVVMNFLLTGRVGSDRNEDWLEYFDVVITGCGKPAFFNSRKPMFEVQTSSGMLRNTDSGNPMVPIGDQDLPSPDFSSTAQPMAEAGQAAVYQGGFYMDLHRMLGVQSGSEVLYVGDHIYGDILRSKKTLGWRTMLVVPELATELDILQQHQGVMDELRSLREARDALDDQIQRMQWGLGPCPSPSTPQPETPTASPQEAVVGATSMRDMSQAEKHDASSNGTATGPHDAASSSGSSMDQEQDDEELVQYQEALNNLKQQRDAIRQQHRQLLHEHHQRFHAVWGQLLKTGYQNSRFAHQVERFACLYTSHVSNLAFYSPDKSYRGRMDHMAHEENPALDPFIR